MGHLLLIESWVGSMSRLLPRAIGESGDRFTFVTRDLHHYLRTAPPPPEQHPLLAARHILTTETNDPDALGEFAERLHGVLRFDGVLSSCDYYLPAAARVAARLGLPGPAPAAVEAACRKDATREALRAAGVPGPAYAVCRDWPATAAAAARIGFPLVIKPVDLCAGMYVRQVADENGLAEAYKALDDFPVNARGQHRAPVVLLEELLTGPEVSVETVSGAGTHHVVGITDKSLGGAPAFIETGHMFPAAVDPATARAAAGTALAALRALGLDQVVTHTEIKLTGSGPRVVEVNPRPAGNRITELVRYVTGIDLPAAAVDVALGRAPRLTPHDTGVGSAAIGFLLADRTGELARVEGAEEAAAAPGVRELRLAAPGHAVRAAASNNDYVGHVLVTDESAGAARDRVNGVLAGLRPAYTDGGAA